MLAFKRMYVDIPTDTHAKLVTEAATRGMSQKGLLAELIEDCVGKSKPKPKRKVSKKSRRAGPSKARRKRKPARRKR